MDEINLTRFIVVLHAQRWCSPAAERWSEPVHDCCDDRQDIAAATWRVHE
jgi:hypothetical protein